MAYLNNAPLASSSSASQNLHQWSFYILLATCCVYRHLQRKILQLLFDLVEYFHAVRLNNVNSNLFTFLFSVAYSSA